MIRISHGWLFGCVAGVEAAVIGSVVDIGTITASREVMGRIRHLAAPLLSPSFEVAISWCVDVSLSKPLAWPRWLAGRICEAGMTVLARP
ncbi:hypothetical protein L2E82_16545 [Cichorium intybus]|uniref:Uncharacterized protein n=1 Tax=Cichorium intybus TaxID=13427 RepID=A0ACB9F765_CICIN|nr:hypothetical protein L2E82_16545 [Cichorium intybus]